MGLFSNYRGVLAACVALACLLFWGYSVMVQDDDIQIQVQQARDAYIAGDFNTAIILYEGLIDRGVVGGAVQYNLGVSYLESGNLGMALLHFFRARLTMPRDPDVSAGIAQVRSERIDVQGDELIFIDRTASLTVALLTRGELLILVSVVWLGLCTLGGAAVLFPNRRQGLRPALVVVTIVFGVLALLGGARWYVEMYRPMGVVIAERVPVYSGPADSYLAMFELSNAAEVRVVERGDAGWGRIVLPDGRNGWIQTDGIQQITPP